MYDYKLVKDSNSGVEKAEKFSVFLFSLVFPSFFFCSSNTMHYANSKKKLKKKKINITLFIQLFHLVFKTLASRVSKSAREMERL